LRGTAGGQRVFEKAMSQLQFLVNVFSAKRSERLEMKRARSRELALDRAGKARFNSLGFGRMPLEIPASELTAVGREWLRWASASDREGGQFQQSHKTPALVYGLRAALKASANPVATRVPSWSPIFRQ